MKRALTSWLLPRNLLKDEGSSRQLCGSLWNTQHIYVEPRLWSVSRAVDMLGFSVSLRASTTRFHTTGAAAVSRRGRRFCRREIVSFPGRRFRRKILAQPSVFDDLRMRLTRQPSFSRTAFLPRRPFAFKWPYETFPRGVNLRTSFLLKVPVLLLEMNRLTVIVGDEWLSWNNHDTLKEAQPKYLCFIPLRWATLRIKQTQNVPFGKRQTHTLNFWHNTWRRTVSSRLRTACQRSWTVTHFCIVSLCGGEIWAVNALVRTDCVLEDPSLKHIV